jgi:hypothetical protein
MKAKAKAILIAEMKASAASSSMARKLVAARRKLMCNGYSAILVESNGAINGENSGL